MVEFVGWNCRAKMAILIEIGVEFGMKMNWLEVEVSRELANPGHTWAPGRPDKIVPNYRVGQDFKIG